MPSRAPRRPALDSPAAVRAQVRRVLRGAAVRVGPIDRMLTRIREQSEELDGLRARVDDQRRRIDEQQRTLDEQRGRIDGQRHALDELGAAKVHSDFFAMLSVDGDAARAAVTLTRALIKRPGGTSEARIAMQVLGRYDGLEDISDLCLALCADAEPMPEVAWTLFGRVDPALVIAWAAHDYFRLGFVRDAGTAAATLQRVLDGDLPLAADPRVWIEIARAAFVAGSVALADRALGRADDALTGVSDVARLPDLRAGITTLREWLARADRPAEPAPAGEIPFALVGYGHPDRSSMSTGLDDFADTLTVLGHLARHESVRFAGDPGLVEVADRVRAGISPGLRITGEAATIRLYGIDRDASRYAAVPEGTWTVISEWCVRPLSDARPDLPLHPALRPLFVSFHITPPDLAAEGVVEYLRDHGPIGCRDRDTVALLHAAGVPAFFSGALAATADTAVAGGGRAGAEGTVFVEVAPDGPGDERGAELAGARDRELGANLAAARAELGGLHDAGARVVTSNVRVHLALRALGCPTELRLASPEDYRALDFADLPDAGFAAMRDGLRDTLAAVVSAITAGLPEKDVYEAWRRACEPALAATATELGRYPDVPQLSFDLAEVCAAIRATTVVSERTAPGPDGTEINVEFSVDENYKHQLDIVLDSVVQRASRPVRAFVLCRGYGSDDFTRMAALFPTVSFVWLQTDRVDYGNVRGKIKWATIVTMDRTILPELLGDVDRIIHFDLDALCLGDLAELYDTDLEGTWIAAVDEPQPAFGHGFASLRDSARLLRSQGQPDLAREYLVRTHTQLAFDFEIFNAGIMVLDLAAMRAGDFCGRFLGYVPRFGINGQRILNNGVGRDRRKVDPEWNRLLRLEVSDSAKIAHWAGPFKPWAGHPYVPGRDLWRAQEAAFAERVGSEPAP